MTEAITANSGIRPSVYKAGRYSIDSTRPAIPRELGYTVDVGVVPHTDFSADGGPDLETPRQGLSSSPTAFETASLGAFRRTAGGAWSAPVSPPVLGVRALVAPYRHLQPLGLRARPRLSREGRSLAELIYRPASHLSLGTPLFVLTHHGSSLLLGATACVSTEAARRTCFAKFDGYLRFFLAEFGGRVGYCRGGGCCAGARTEHIESMMAFWIALTTGWKGLSAVLLPRGGGSA